MKSSSASQDLREFKQTLAGFGLAGAVAGLVDIVASSIKTPFDGPAARVEHALLDGLTLIGLGLILGGLEALRAALASRSPKLAFAVQVGLAGAAASWVLDRIIVRQSVALFGGRFEALLLVAIPEAVGLGLALLPIIAGFAERRSIWLARLLTAIGLGALIGQQVVLRDDYMEGHTAVVWASLTMLGSLLAPAATRLFARAPRAAIVLGSASLIALAVPPSNRARLALHASPGAAPAWLLANLVWTLPEFSRADTTGNPWLEVREGSRPGAPRDPASAPVVVLLTIDATRADVLTIEGAEERFPNLSRMKREGTYFSNARSAGSQTAVSLAALFSGKYFSEMRWEKFGEGNTRFDYPAVDRSPRLAELLAAQDVRTVKVASLTFLTNRFGIAPGFEDEIVVTQGRKHATAPTVMKPLLGRVRAAPAGAPLFAFAHLTEPHAPYNRGKTPTLIPYAGYLDEVELADAAVGELMDVLSQRHLRDRAILIVSSDHGEAFGEHGTREHTKTIYEELLRVPLLVWGHGVTQQEIAEPVTLLDLSPTILDLFGADVPAAMTGESLLPVLRGAPPAFTRPIFAEGRLRRAHYHGSVKVIVDTRRKVIEAFDLEADPKELRNLFDERRPDVDRALSDLVTFFENRTFAEDGYRPIYKP